MPRAESRHTRCWGLVKTYQITTTIGLLGSTRARGSVHLRWQDSTSSSRVRHHRRYTPGSSRPSCSWPPLRTLDPTSALYELTPPRRSASPPRWGRSRRSSWPSANIESLSWRVLLPVRSTYASLDLCCFEVRGDQVGVNSLALRLEVDPVFHEELRPSGARSVPVHEHGFVWIPPHPVGQHIVV